jgi:hypothetical protein
MDERVLRLKTPREATNFANNARERGHFDLEAQAIQRGRELQALIDGYTTPAQQAIAVALYAYEEQQSLLTGRKNYRANRTRQMLANRGILEAAERMVLNRQTSAGYAILKESGLKDQTFEAIIDRFPDEFHKDAVEAARARLDGKPLPVRSVDDSTDVSSTTPFKVDAEVLNFLSGFRKVSDWYQENWLPKYRVTIAEIAKDLSEKNYDRPFDTLWRQSKNHISNAGQGVLGYKVIDGLRDELIQVTSEIYEDGSPEHYELIVERFEGWKKGGRTDKVPHLLIARAFAGIHPYRYHTTVDEEAHNKMLDWFVEHSGFYVPSKPNWALRAQALVKHLDRMELFGSDFQERNLFPWFVVDQLRGRGVLADVKPGHNPRPATAVAHLPEAERLIKLREGVIQTALYQHLISQFPGSAVYTEYSTGTGGKADAVVRHANGRCYLYEIKVADMASEVVRRAMGQLLEYGFREGGLRPEKLFVVGEPALDAITHRFLALLRVDFNIDIEYLQISLAD